MPTTSNQQIIKWLNTAITAEKTALTNYLQFARQTKDETGKNMFIRLAQDEYSHMDLLEKELETVQASKKWMPAKLKKSDIEKIVPSLKKLENISQGMKGDAETTILTTARDAEKEAMEFYAEIAEKIDDPAARNLLNRLAEMEESHYEILQAELDYINKTGFWMGFKEVSFEAE
ncbi:MAG: ferritin family protein [Planctomycetes bacterium]|nr:ferritin family protein [Planctomycetota bacterium]